MKYLICIALFISCTKAGPVVFDPGRYNVNDSWAWEFTPDGTLIEPEGCGVWYVVGNELVVTSGYLRATYRGPVDRVPGGYNYEGFKMRKL